jgi:predicted component of type VI protein secretion system
MIRKLVVDDGGSARELLLVGTMVVGRDPDCEISHKDPRLSRRHAEFSIGDAGVIVRDLDSRNGIRVNGGAVKEAVLQPGDVVQIAQLTVHFVDGDERAAARTSGSVDLHSSLSIAAGVEDDRTRAVASGGAAAPGSRATMDDVRQVRASAPLVRQSDDRTRVVNGAQAARPKPPPVAADLADVVFREPPPSLAAAQDASPEGLESLLAVGWGRRVLLQTFGVTAAQSLVALAPPLLAAGAAGVLVASLIARTTARGLQSDAPSRKR